MEIEFENQKTQKEMCDMKLLTAKIGLSMAKTVKQRYNQIEACENFKEYMNTGLGIPHPLSNKDNRKLQINSKTRVFIKRQNNNKRSVRLSWRQK